jgi:hypothetical protein
MKKTILLIAFLFVSILGYSQNNVRDIKIRNSLTLQDSNVTNITTGDTLATKEWTIENAAILTGNPTEIFFNSGGILGSSPLFTYDPSDSTLTVDSLQLANGEKISWNSDDNTINIPTGFGSVIQAGQEIQIKVYNSTGSLIPNGSAVYPSGIFNDFGSISLAQSNSHENIGVDYGLTTISIDDNNFGFVVWFGKARDLNTSMYNLGDTIWISASNAGELTNVMPSFPNYAIQIGIVMKVGVSDGIIFVTSRSTIDDTFINFYNGVIRENFDFRVTATGGVITGTLSPTNGHPDLTLIFSDGFTTFDTSPSATITLTAGTNKIPQMNYVYIPKSTKVLTVSTSSFPTTEHKAIAKLLLKSSDFVEKYKATINQNINDPLANTTTFQGQLSVITKRIRRDHAKHISGTEGVSTIETGPTPDDVWVSVTEGRVAQLNDHTFPAFDSQTGDSLYISNHFTNPDTLIGNLNELLNDALGNSINNTSLSVVSWGVINKTGEPSLVKINLPVGTYAFASPDNAVSDALNYSVYSFPTEYTGVGFLIARFTYTYKNDVWVLIDTEDLTGFTPNTAAGGGAGGAGVTTFLGLTDTESSYTAYEFQVANAGATALESPSNLVYDGTHLGIGTSSPNLFVPLTISSSVPGIQFIDIDGADWLYNADAGSFTIKEGVAGSAPITHFTIESGGDILLGVVAKTHENVTEQFIINPQGDLTGTLAAPNLAFTNSDLTTDVGLFLISDNNLAITVNSIEAMRLTEDDVTVDSSLYVGGNVGIGTITPLRKLEVFDATNSVIGLFKGNNATANYIDINNLNAAGDVGIRFQSETSVKWAVGNHKNNSDAFTIGSGAFGSSDKFIINRTSGNISINNTNDIYKFDVNGTGRFTGIVNFDVFPITPSSAPTTDYQVANKKYVDDNISGSGTFYYAVNPSSFIASAPNSDPVALTTGQISASSSTINIYAPINLPHGATVTSVIVRGDVSTRTWALTRFANGGSTGNGLATAVLNTVDTSISLEVIDNENYNYGISVSQLEVGEKVYDATIIYTL